MNVIHFLEFDTAEIHASGAPAAAVGFDYCYRSQTVWELRSLSISTDATSSSYRVVCIWKQTEKRNHDHLQFWPLFLILKKNEMTIQKKE